MKKILPIALLALVQHIAFATTMVAPSLLNPTGSSAGQAIVSTGSSTSPTWQSVVNSIIAGAGVTISGATGNVTVSVTTNGVTLGQLAQQPANTVLANATGSTANVTAFTVPGCSTSSSALTWTSGTGFTCNTTVNASTLGGTAAASYALLASPTFTGTPAAPTATAGTNTTQIATTAFAQNAVTGGANAGAFTTLSATGLITPSSTAGIKGTSTNDNANAGSVGEYQMAASASTAITTGTTTNIVSLPLSAGDWDVSGVVNYVPAAGTTTTVSYTGISTSSGALQSIGSITQYPFTAPAGTQQTIPTPTVRVSVSATTTVYVVANVTFSGGTCNTLGFVRARRVR